MSTNSIILGRFGSEYKYINCDVDGKLNVNLESEVLDVSGSVTIVNQIEGYATEASLITVAEGNAIIGAQVEQLNDKIILDGDYLQANVMSLPAITIENTSFQVSNFPTSFEVSNTVSVLDSNTEAMNVKFHNADAPYTDAIKCYSVNNIASVDVSNFPTSFEVSNFPSIQDVSGSITVSNQISGYATEASLTSVVDGNAIIGTQIEQLNDKIILDGDYLQANVKNFPLSFEVSALPSITIGNTSFEVSNFPSIQDVSGTVTFSNTTIDVGNFPATQPVSGSVNVTTSLPIDVNVTNTGTNIPVDLKVISMAGGCVPTATNDGWNNGITSTAVSLKNGLDMNVINTSLPVTGTFWQATQPVSGTVAVSGSVATTGTYWQATQPVSIASVVDVSDSTSHTNLTTINTTLSNSSTGLPGVNTKLTSLISKTGFGPGSSEILRITQVACTTSTGARFLMTPGSTSYTATTYTTITSPQVFNVRSSTAANSNVTPAGCRSVRVTGIGASGEISIEDVDLNGVTNVPTVGAYTSILNIESINGAIADTTTIYATPSSGSTGFRHCEASNVDKYTPAFTVPTGYTAVCTRISWIASTAGPSISILVNKSGSALQDCVWMRRRMAAAGETVNEYNQWGLWKALDAGDTCMPYVVNADSTIVCVYLNWVLFPY